jgi:predicted CoA-substrate-specific enzyme activase
MGVQMLTAGIDIGSTMTKAVILQNGKVLSEEITQTGTEHKALAHLVMEAALNKAGLKLSRIDYIVGTGYGRPNIPFADRQITEITCHGRGIAALFPEAKTVVEIGGQDCKVIRLENGKVTDFAMNEKCAAGTGRFLQSVADMLELSIDEMNNMALAANGMVSISNYCAIFTQQEIIASLSMGISTELILSGVFDAFARRVIKLARSRKIVREVVLTGGGAKHRALHKAVESILGFTVLVPEKPLLTGAYGAAILAMERTEREGSLKKQRILNAISVS